MSHAADIVNAAVCKRGPASNFSFTCPSSHNPLTKKELFVLCAEKSQFLAVMRALTLKITMGSAFYHPIDEDAREYCCVTCLKNFKLGVRAAPGDGHFLCLDCELYPIIYAY